MQKIIIPVLAIFCSFSISQAQKAYIKLGAGYNFSINNAIVESYFLDQKGDYKHISTDGITRTNGSYPSLQMGMPIHSFMNLELGAIYIKSKESSFREASKYTRPINTNMADVAENSYTVENSRSLFLYPSVVFHKPFGKRAVAGYAKAGLAITALQQTNSKTNKAASITVESTTALQYIYHHQQTHYKIGIGYTGALGIEKKITEHLSIRGEVHGQFLKSSPKYTESLAYAINTKDVLSTTPVYDKEIIYVPNVNNQSNNAQYNPHYDSNKPKEVVGQKDNFHAVGISVGLKYTFL